MAGSTPHICLELASPADDEALRSLLASVEMEGSIRVTFQREPDFFEAAAVEGPDPQVLVARDRRAGRLAATGTRSIRTRYVNGEPTPVGYLSALRCRSEYRGGTVLARGYRFLAQLHEDRRALLYVTTIAADNHTALGALTGGRAGLPSYRPVGAYHTLALPTRRRRPHPRPPGLDVRFATPDDMPMLVGFLQEAARGRQFAPQYTERDLLGPGRTFRDLAPGDIGLAFRDGRIVGTLASWNASRFRQTVVSGYAPVLGALRGLHNAWARVRGAAELPAPGEALCYRMMALPFVAADDADVFRALLDTVLARHAQQAAGDPSARLALLGLHASDPLLGVSAPMSSRTYVTQTFIVHWADGAEAFARIDDRPIYLELGCL